MTQATYNALHGATAQADGSFAKSGVGYWLKEEPGSEARAVLK